jgi:imidazole glycerol-phosphate synthase subunit HisH
MNVVIIDYGLGNLWSVKSALKYIGNKVLISADPDHISKADFLILPGVGSFGAGMKNLKSRGLIEVLHHAVAIKNIPILGICLGMQLLANMSEESPGVKGLGLVPGKILKFIKGSHRLPHMGFNSVEQVNDNNELFKNIRKVSDFYFVHSYYFSPINHEYVIARTTYDIDFASVVKKNNIVGVQFHPEKSQGNGIKLLSNILEYSLVI